MKLNAFIFLSILAVFSFCGCKSENETYGSALVELDRLISLRKDTESMMKSKEDSLKSKYATSPDAFSKYAVAKQIFEEFSRYDFYVSMEAAHNEEKYAKETGVRNLIYVAVIDLADRHEVSGSYSAALEDLNQIDTSYISNYQKRRLYNIQQRIYHSMYLTTKDPVKRQLYQEKSFKYGDILSSITGGESLDYAIVAARKEIENGADEEARRIIEDYLNNNETSYTNKAGIHYWLARTYKKEANTDHQILHYAISAQYDMMTPVKASRSLINLARLLYEAGDVDHAFRYILIAYDDAIQCDARVALKEIDTFLPRVINSYEDLKTRRARMHKWFLLVSAILILLMTVLIIVSNNERLKIKKMQLKILQNNEDINNLNANLKLRVVQLKESNEIKDFYIGRYMSMFSNHIDSLERYRSKLRAVAKSYDMQELMKTLHSNIPIEEEREALFNEFDRTFLDLFPDFVEQVNNLLHEGCQIGQKLKPKTLTSELRIFALIRLGVTDSKSIAKFLRKSPSTVYNYRVKLRNNAKIDRNDFESQIMKIGNIG